MTLMVSLYFLRANATGCETIVVHVIFSDWPIWMGYRIECMVVKA